MPLTKIQEYNLAKSNPSLAIFQAIQELRSKLTSVVDEFQKIKNLSFPDIPKSDLTETNKLLSHLIELAEKNKEPEKISVNLKIE